MVTIYVPALRLEIGLVLAPLLQLNEYGSVPPVTVNEIEPF